MKSESSHVQQQISPFGLLKPLYQWVNNLQKHFNEGIRFNIHEIHCEPVGRAQIITIFGGLRDLPNGRENVATSNQGELLVQTIEGNKQEMLTATSEAIEAGRVDVTCRFFV